MFSSSIGVYSAMAGRQNAAFAMQNTNQGMMALMGSMGPDMTPAQIRFAGQQGAKLEMQSVMNNMRLAFYQAWEEAARKQNAKDVELEKKLTRSWMA